MVVIAAPHTSNWDFPLLLLFAWSYGVHLSFLMKHSLFRGPVGSILSALGGIPVRRDRTAGLVKELAETFSDADRLALVIPAEGTRGHTTYWKSGFYHVARAARVPLALSYLDYAHKRGGFGPVFLPTGNVREDMELIRDFYADKVGRHPEKFGEIRLREEESGGTPSAD